MERMSFAESDKSFALENQKRLGINLFTDVNERLVPILRIEVNANTAFKMEDALDANARQVPYIPDSDKSLYVKPPLGASYVTSTIAKKFSTTEQVYFEDLNVGNVIYDPQLSWHGGTGGRDLMSSNGMIALRGRSTDGVKQRPSYNEVPAIAKDSLAGNYNPIANVKLPISISSYPESIGRELANNPICGVKYVDQSFQSSVINSSIRDIILDVGTLRSGVEIIIVVHNPSPLHKSRFHEHDRALWVYEPITFMPAEDTALAFTILTYPSNENVNLVNGPITFMGVSIDPSMHIGFQARKV